MMMRLVSALFLSLAITASGAMTGDRMVELVQEQDPAADVGGHRVRFTRKEHNIELIYDVHADRMRLIAPIKSTDDLQEDEMRQMLEANFHTSLDVRYATSRGTVYAAYLHPLHSLEEPQFLGAIDMVATAAKTFGSAYSAGSLNFYGTGSGVTTTSSAKATKPKAYVETANLRSEVSTSTVAQTTEMAREMESEGPLN